MRTFRNLSLLALSLAACGDDGKTNPIIDAFVPGVDSPIDAPPPPPGCDYGELNDAGNDDFSSMTGLPEMTNKTFTANTVLCGKIDSTHFEAGMGGAPGLVDIDSYAVTLSAPATVLVTLTGPGVEALGGVEVDVYGGQQFQDFFGAGRFVTNHGVTALNLDAGTYEFAMIAENAAAITAPVDYKIKIIADAPLTRCPHVTTGGFAEPATNDNDVIKVDFAATPSRTLTASTTDAATPSAITTVAGTNARISGNSDPNAADADYKDRDTFSFTTGADTNEVSLRLNWTGANDLDFYVFEAANIATSAGSSLIAANAEDEFDTFAVKPSTSYWVWAAGYKTNTAVAAIPYDISICPTNFTP